MHKTDIFTKDEVVIQYEGTIHETEVTYINDFMFKGERWFNVKLSNGGFMETQHITKKKS